MGRLLVVAPDTLHPVTHGAAARTMNVARLARGAFAEVDVEGLGPALDVEAEKGLRVRQRPPSAGGVDRVSRIARMLFHDSFGHRFPDAWPGAPDLVQIESPFLHPAVARRWRGPLVLDAHNVYQDIAAFPQVTAQDRVFHALTRRRQARVETACWARADHVLFCSEVDRDRADALLPGVKDKSTVLPNCVDTTRFRPPSGGRRPAGGPIVFMGTTRYPPNFFAVDLIARELAPALPDQRFVVVGDAPHRPRVVPPNLTFAGRVEDPRTCLAEASAAIAPLHHGSGTRLKLLEYFASGLPVVATRKAAEGLQVEDRRDLLFAETGAAFAEALRALASDPATGARLGAAARSLVERRYDWEVHRDALGRAYQAALG